MSAKTGLELDSGKSEKKTYCRVETTKNGISRRRALPRYNFFIVEDVAGELAYKNPEIAVKSGMRM